MLAAKSMWKQHYENDDIPYQIKSSRIAQSEDDDS